MTAIRPTAEVDHYKHIFLSSVVLIFVVKQQETRAKRYIRHIIGYFLHGTVLRSLENIKLWKYSAMSFVYLLG